MRNWNHESSVAAKWWADQTPDCSENGMARIFGLLLGELYAQERNPEIEHPHLRIALRIDAPSTPVRKMTMHISVGSVKVYTGFASEGPQTELIKKPDAEIDDGICPRCGKNRLSKGALYCELCQEDFKRGIC